ncbi:hypothetical protein, conserved in T. vivax [Trypanosoma vivax Y486]|uniref:Uncharacterized protein n=1 Tax=Trypanosoma vivax (strain Y486) TaxID=1055687 RepID=F9WUW4_TRYVY|nr:hypothetical protein, conserved in T. vivax [Trypanosoma vivax Y486]|eukprot:CCD21363.1 hypothetical protein, conserved in T. vivax [Trypanosoma vivax Y486]
MFPRAMCDLHTFFHDIVAVLAALSCAWSSSMLDGHSSAMSARKVSAFFCVSPMILLPCVSYFIVAVGVVALVVCVQMPAIVYPAKMPPPVAWPLLKVGHPSALPTTAVPTLTSSLPMPARLARTPPIRCSFLSSSCSSGSSAAANRPVSCSLQLPS